MQKRFLKFGKVFTNVTFSPLILILNNSELAAKYLPNDVDQSRRTLEIPNINNVFFQGIDIKKEKKFLLAENNNDINEKSVVISEIIIEGWENHPEGRKLELAAYDSMSIKPGSIVDNQILNKDLNAIYASGWFSGVKIKSQEGPLGVRLIVNVVPNPILKKVELKPINSVISNAFIDNIFKNFYGTTLNSYEEGCLSIPGVYLNVVRPSTIKLKFRDEMGRPRKMKADGLLARCIQHEMDHLNGILFVDRVHQEMI